MKEYTEPIIEIIRLDEVDILTESFKCENNTDLDFD